MKIAVTGAAGFIGRYVLAELGKHPVERIAMVRNRTAAGLPDPSITTVTLDLLAPPPDPFAALGHPDAVIHLAWGGLPNYRSLHHFETELPGQYRFLSALIKGGLSALIVSGTCFEYGMQSGALCETVATAPSNPYGFAKDTLRKQLFFLKQTIPFSLAWCRLFYLYGDGQPATSLYTQLSDAAGKGETSFGMSGGEQLRDYLPVEEAAAAITALALRRDDIGIVNVCSGKPVAVRTLTEAWLRRNAWNMRLDFGVHPYPDHEPMAFWGDRTKLDTCLRSHEQHR